MSKRIFQVPSFTPTATADTATTLANGTYLALGAAGATQTLKILDVIMDGLATASNVNLMMLARDHVLGATLTALAAPNSDGPMDTNAAALAAPPLSFVAATTPPQRSILTTAARLNLGFNAFGGFVRMGFAPGEEWTITGVTVDVSETSLSAYTGGTAGLIGASLVYEPT